MRERPYRKPLFARIAKDFSFYKVAYLMALPVVLYYIIFRYIPMYGAVIAFKDFSPGRGILGSSWVGLRNFVDFFQSVYFTRVVRNTFLINLYGLIFGFPVPIILALLINEIRNSFFKRVVQTVTYMPYFISLVVVAGIIIEFTSQNGLINKIIELFSGRRISIMNFPQYFRPVYIISDIWQGMGFGSIIYLAAIAGIDQELYEAARMDGANRWQQTLTVTLPSMIPTILILLILRIGQMMSLGFEKIILLYNAAIYETADVISSFVYRRGLQEFSYSFSTAVGLFNSVINFTLIVTANWLSRKIKDTNIW
jgi:putative aldouronate transport system permease protein